MSTRSPFGMAAKSVFSVKSQQHPHQTHIDSKKKQIVYDPGIKNSWVFRKPYPFAQIPTFGNFSLSQSALNETPTPPILCHCATQIHRKEVLSTNITSFSAPNPSLNTTPKTHPSRPIPSVVKHQCLRACSMFKFFSGCFSFHQNHSFQWTAQRKTSKSGRSRS